MSTMSTKLMPMANRLLFFAFFTTCASLSDSSQPCWTGNPCGGSSCISGVNLNFTVSWDACQENASASSFILSSCDERPKMILCETNNTSCFIGGRLLEGLSNSYFWGILCLQRSASGEEHKIVFTRSDYLVGQPDILSSDVKSRNITLTLRGPLTPIYRVPGDEMYRSLDSTEVKHNKTYMYMGMEFITNTIDCLSTLYNSTGDPLYQVENYLGYKSAQRKFDFTNLVPYTRYQIKIKCKLNNHWSNYTTYDFITPEDVPARGPSVLKPDSVGLGCEKPDQRNVTIVIEPPPLEDHNGRLLFYEIRYRQVSSGPEREDNETRMRVDLPDPSARNSSMMVALDDLLRWEAYNIVVYANNSVGGAPSSTHQIPVLQPEIHHYQPLNLTKTRVEPDGWHLEWLSPWPQNQGDCISHYEVSAVKDDRYLGSTNNTSFFLPTDNDNPVASVRVTAMLYSGTGFSVSGLSSDPITLGESSSYSAPLSTPLIVLLSILLFIFIVLTMSCAYMCIEHGPRWTENYDFHNNSVLKAALAMGDLRPRPPLEKEEFNNIVNVPPQESPSESANSAETRVLLVAETEPEVGEMAEPRTPTHAQMPPPSTEGHQALVRGSRSEEICPSLEADERSGCIPAEEEEEEDSGCTLVVSCDLSKDYREVCARYEESPVASPPPLVFRDTGYVAIPQIPVHAAAPSSQRDGHCRMDTLRNIPCRIAKDDGKRWQECDADRSDGYVSKYVQSTLRNEPLPSPGATDPYIRLSDVAGRRPGRDGDDAAMKSRSARQTSVDSEGTSSRSLSPAHSDVGEYTKLSCPNTPVSPRNHSAPDTSLLSLARAVEENFQLIQGKHGCSTESHQHGLSNVA